MKAPLTEVQTLTLCYELWHELECFPGQNKWEVVAEQTKYYEGYLYQIDYVTSSCWCCEYKAQQARNYSIRKHPCTSHCLLWCKKNSPNKGFHNACVQTCRDHTSPYTEWNTALSRAEVSIYSKRLTYTQLKAISTAAGEIADECLYQLKQRGVEL